MKLALFLVLAVIGVVPVGADTYDEKLDYIDTTGTQWIDTGILPRLNRFQMVY